MRVLSLFDGMACGMLAMQDAGITVDRYVAYEYDEETANETKGRPYGFAALTASHNFPMIEQRGNVFQADFTEFKAFDFVLAGFPCTKFSIAQKNDRETEPYSGEGWLLFEQAWRAVCEAKPQHFIFENNKSMAKAVQQEISKIVGFEPICINSALVSAQNRQRLYWVGRRNPDGTYSRVQVDQPEDRGILLRDVLYGVTDREKACCVIGSIGRTTTREYFQKNQGTMAFETVPCQAEPVCMRYQRSEEAKKIRKQYEAGEIHHGFRELSELHPRTDGKTNTISTVLKDNPICEPVRIPEYGNKDKGRPLGACYSKNCGGFESRMFSKNTHKQQVDMIAQPVKVGEIGNGGQGNRIYSIDGKSVAKTATSGGIGSNTGLYAIPVEFDGDTPIKAVSLADGKTYTVYQVKDGQITIKGKTYPIKLADGFYIIRKLTVSECKRLQTVPEWYKFPVSDSQAYKMLGNGWTVLIIAHLIKAINLDKEE